MSEEKKVEKKADEEKGMTKYAVAPDSLTKEATIGVKDDKKKD